MTNNPPAGYHLNNPWALSCKQQIIALSKVCNVNTIILEQKIVVFSLLATTCNIPRFYQILGEIFCFCFA
jgi:hypothetical protein